MEEVTHLSLEQQQQEFTSALGKKRRLGEASPEPQPLEACS
jgi:hypothetical protein